MPTCVGFGTGRSKIIARSFSWKLASISSLLARAFFTHHTFELIDGFAYQSSPVLAPTIPAVGPSSLLRHSITFTTGTGISTSCPSTTLVSLVLGPDLPRADEPSPGILGLSVRRILTYISLLTPAYSLPYWPMLLTVHLLPVWNAPLPLTLLSIRSFGIMLSPGKFSAQSHSTSELLRTLSRVAASKPTS